MTVFFAFVFFFFFFGVIGSVLCYIVLMASFFACRLAKKKLYVPVCFEGEGDLIFWPSFNFLCFLHNWFRPILYRLSVFILFHEEHLKLLVVSFE